jgi:hypothetical protein
MVTTPGKDSLISITLSWDGPKGDNRNPYETPQITESVNRDNRNTTEFMTLDESNPRKSMNFDNINTTKSMKIKDIKMTKS